MRHSVLLSAVVVCGLVLGLGQASPAQSARRVELRADTLIVNASAQSIDARGHVRISDGRLVILAARAIYYVRDRRMLLSGDVTVTSSDGTLRSRQATLRLSRNNTIDTVDAQGAVIARSGLRTLQAQRLMYAIANTQLSATGQVQITTPTAVATGRTLVADLRRNTGTLTGARLRSKEGVVSGDRLEVAGATGQAFFRGHVVAEFDTTKITAEAATVEERQKKITFRGKVRITRPGRVLLADTVTFYYRENRLVAEGQTRILIQESP